MEGESKKPMLKPAIIIGLGGTGNQVVRRLKKMLQDQYGGKTPLLLNFLVADTDEDTFNDASWAPLPALDVHEKVELYNRNVPFSDVRDNPGHYPEIHEWLPSELTIAPMDRHKGAEQIRMRGRVALYAFFDFFTRRVTHFFDECEQIDVKLQAMQQYDFNVEADPIVYIVASVCGGQGAGSFIDAAVMLRTLAENRFPRLNLVGILVMPSVYTSQIPRENLSQVQANTHAAMKELDYLMHSPSTSRTRFVFPEPIGRTVTPEPGLFDLCYLVDIRNARGALPSKEDVFDQIATQLYLEIGTPFGARSESVRVNLNTVAGLTPDRAYGTGRRYSGFGNHTISFDRERIVALASLKSAYTAVNDVLKGRGLESDVLDRAVAEFVGRHHIDEAATDDLVNTLVSSREIGQEQITAAWASERAGHEEFAHAAWERLDTFWQRRALDLRAQMDRRARVKLDGGPEQTGILDDLERLVDAEVRRNGAAAALDLVKALLSRLRAFEELMREEFATQEKVAQKQRSEVETHRTELTTIGQQLRELENKDERVSLFSRVWRGIGVAVTLGSWKPDGGDEAERAREVQELTARAKEERAQLQTAYNQAVERRLAREAREAAAGLYGECVARLSDLSSRLDRAAQTLEKAAGLLQVERDKLAAETGRTRYIGGNTMRRDVTADYVDQYHKMYSTAATAAVMASALPPDRSALASLEKLGDRDAIRQKFHERYAQDILLKKDRDSLADMIERAHSDGLGGGLTDRIGEGLRFCLPFWDMKAPGTQPPTEVLLVGLEQSHPGVDNYLERHATAQHGQVFHQLVPTGHDSMILISRIAHGASYYWHAQDDKYWRQYIQMAATAPYRVHLNSEWRKLPEPIPDPSKYERRVFALGIAYELIAVRGSAYYIDFPPRYSLVGTTRQEKPDWVTIPLLKAPPLPDHPAEPVAPDRADEIDDDSRIEAMQKFMDSPDRVEMVREALLRSYSSDGREAVRENIERYCAEVLQPALRGAPANDPVRDQLEVELQALGEIAHELTPATGKLILRR